MLIIRSSRVPPRRQELPTTLGSQWERRGWHACLCIVPASIDDVIELHVYGIVSREEAECVSVPHGVCEVSGGFGEDEMPRVVSC